jgi:hypothetical protein
MFSWKMFSCCSGERRKGPARSGAWTSWVPGGVLNGSRVFSSKGNHGNTSAFLTTDPSPSATERLSPSPAAGAGDASYPPDGSVSWGDHVGSENAWFIDDTLPTAAAAAFCDDRGRADD